MSFMVRVQKSPESLQLRQQCYSWIFHPDNSPRMPRESIMQSVILAGVGLSVYYFRGSASSEMLLTEKLGERSFNIANLCRL